MEIARFAEKHHLKTRRDECGETIIPGKNGHIYKHSNDLLGIVLMFKTERKWSSRRRRLDAARFQVHLDCETEGILLFDPVEKKQVKAAIHEAHVRIRRKLDPEQAAKLAERLREGREKSKKSP